MSGQKFSFNNLKEDGSARLGKIITHRGEINTHIYDGWHTRHCQRCFYR